MKKTNRTPGPIQIEEASEYGVECRIVGSTKTHSGRPLQIATVKRIASDTVSPQTADGESRANAEFMVRAWNNHAALVALAVDFKHHVLHKDDIDEEDRDLLAHIDNLLANVKEN